MMGAPCLATVRGERDHVVFEVPEARTYRWVSVVRVHGTRYHDEGDVTEVRPLVPLDLDVASYAATALEGSADNGDRYCARQIRDAMPKPPPMEEPGLWGVVIASRDGDPKRREWVHGRKNSMGNDWYCTETSICRQWADLVEPEPVRDGFDPGAAASR